MLLCRLDTSYGKRKHETTNGNEMKEDVGGCSTLAQLLIVSVKRHGDIRPPCSLLRVFIYSSFNSLPACSGWHINTWDSHPITALFRGLDCLYCTGIALKMQRGPFILPYFGGLEEFHQMALFGVLITQTSKKLWLEARVGKRGTSFDVVQWMMDGTGYSFP